MLFLLVQRMVNSKSALYLGVALFAVFAVGATAYGVAPGYDGTVDPSTDPFSAFEDFNPNDPTTNDPTSSALQLALGSLQTSISGLLVTGGGIQLFAQAIGFAEGFGIAGKVPTLANNPGDLSKGDFGDTGKYLTAGDGEQVIVYPDAATGWNNLYKKLQNILNGNSRIYEPSMTIYAMGNIYAGSASIWSNSVVTYLNQHGRPDVTAQTPLSAVLNG